MLFAFQRMRSGKEKDYPLSLLSAAPILYFLKNNYYG